MNPKSKAALCEALRTLGTCDVTVGGRSMWPFIRPGDTVTIRGGAVRPRRGMVVAFFSGEQLIVHRVTGHKRRADGSWDIRVQGDSSPGTDAAIAQDSIVGSVAGIKRNGRKNNAWLRPPFSWIAVVAGVALRTAVTLSSRRVS